jgi:hypothetical protein
MKFKSVNKLFTLIICYKLLKYLFMKHSITKTLLFLNKTSVESLTQWKQIFKWARASLLYVDVL